MALLYRMGTGNGSGGDLKPYTVNFKCASGYIGQTLTMTYKGTPHAGETVDNVSGTVASDGTLTLYPMHSGNWECSCYSSVTGTTIKKTIELSYWGTTNVSFEDTPNGATVTPTDDVQTWLHCANIWDKTDLTTINGVIADTTTLNILISDNNASDYLARSTTWVSDVCNNESAMIYIGLNDYCANKLLADSTWLETICSTEETLLKKVLNVFVPTLTGNTGSDGGEVSASSEGSSNDYAYYAFNDNPSNHWAGNGVNNYLRYDFKRPVNVKKVYLAPFKDYTHGDGVKTFKIQASNDNFATVGYETKVLTHNSADLYDEIILDDNNSYFSCYQILVISSYQYNSVIEKLQFYGREEA